MSDFNLDKFMEKTLEKEKDKREPVKFSDEQNPWLIFRKKYSELPQNRITYGNNDEKK
jgi:hypothetical protein